MKINCDKAAALLKSSDNILILTHASPDGDTLGSGFGLCRVLRLMGKKANVLCPDGVPERYGFLKTGYEDEDFEIKTVISVDVADVRLLGRETAEKYADNIFLCIDHHITNTEYAENLMLGETSASACEVVYKVIKAGGFPMDEIAAMCLYTGTATDTGCFKYDSVTSETHAVAAELYKYKFPVPAARLNRMLFDVKSPTRIKAEHLVMNNAEIICGGKAAITYITLEEKNAEGFTEDDFDGIASVLLQLESIEIAVTAKEKEKDVFKISARSGDIADVSRICAEFDGGGHIRAAGCTIKGTLPDVISRLKKAVQEELANVGL